MATKKIRKDMEMRRERMRNLRSNSHYCTNVFGEEFTHAEAGEFLFNSCNSMNCTKCPENRGMDGNFPCGQQNCWVDVHCDGGGGVNL